MGIKMPEYKWQIFAVTGLANMAAAFAINSINLALPVMSAEFGVSMGTISWLSLVYSFIPSCTLLIFGRLADLYGYKRQFVGGFCVFGLASLLLPVLSKGLAALILFRCLQAVGYGMLISITQAMCNQTFPASERGRALGVNSVFVSVGHSIGPSVSGLLMSRFSWRSIFYFNVPFCVLGIVMSLLILKPDKPEADKPRQMDWPGSVYFALCIGLLAVAINFSADWGLGSAKFFGCLGAAAVMLLLFICRERRAEPPLMKLELFRSPVFTLANGACVFSYMIQQMTTFLVPFFLMDVLLVSKSGSGFIMLATPLSMIVFSPVGGRMADRKGSRLPALAGLGLIALGCVLMSFLSGASTVIYVIIGLLCYGVGNGLSVSAINTAIFSGVPREYSGVASGMVATMRNLGQGLGVAFGGTIMTLRQSHYAALAADTGSQTGQTAAGQVYLLAQRDAFYFGLAIVAAAIVCMVMIPGRKKG